MEADPALEGYDRPPVDERDRNPYPPILLDQFRPVTRIVVDEVKNILNWKESKTDQDSWAANEIHEMWLARAQILRLPETRYLDGDRLL
jgi:hypothetical protein